MPGFMDTLLQLSKTVGTVLGGPVVPAVLEIGKDVLKLIDEAKDVVEEKDQAKLIAMRDELEPLVLAHADSTEDKLRG